MEKDILGKKIMIKKMLIVSLCVILMFSSVGAGKETATDKVGLYDDIDIVWRTTFANRYKSIGRSKFGEEGLFHNGITFDFKNNFLFDVGSYHSMGSGYEDGEKFSYALYYKEKFFEGESYEISSTAKYLFYDFARGNRYDNYQETGVKFSFSNLFKFSNGDKIIPSYYPLVFLKHTGHIYNGTAHIFGLDYVKKINEDIESKLYCDLIYNDSIGNSKSAFSHSTIGVSFNIKLDDSTSIIPFYGYQFSFEENIVGDSGPCFGIVFRIKF